jgi:hypothetical protein
MTISELEKQLRQRDALIEKQAAQIKVQAARIQELEREMENLKKLLVEKAQSKEAKPPKEATNYSVDRTSENIAKSDAKNRPADGGKM